MTTEAYRIGMSFIVDTNATSETAAISKQFEALQKVIDGAKRSLAELASGMRVLKNIGNDAAASWQRAAQAMERAAGAATKAASTSMGAGAGYGGGGGGGGGTASAGPRRAPSPPVMIGYDGSRALVPYQGGGGDLVPSGGGGGRMPPLMLGHDGAGGGGAARGPRSDAPGWLALAADYVGIKQALDQDLAERQALRSMGYKRGTPEFDAAMHRLSKTSSSAASGTIFSQAQVASGYPTSAGVLGFGGDTPEQRAAALDKFAAIYPTIIRAAEVAQMMGLGGLNESIPGLIGYAHMTDRYDPAQLEPGIDELLNIAQLTHNSVTGEQGTFKYSLPLAMAAGMKPADAAAITGFLQIMGMNGTTAGTGFGQLITGLFPSSLQRLDSKHNEALKSMGIIDAKGKVSEDVMPDGRLDGMALLKHIAEFAKTHKPAEVLQALRNAFTVRAMRVAGTFEGEDTIARLQNYIDQLNRLPGAKETQAALADSPLQQMEQGFARLKDVMNNLIAPTLPTLTTLFGALKDTMGHLNDALIANPGAAGALGIGALGIGGAAAMKGAGRLLGLFPATAGAGAAISALAPLIGAILTSVAIKNWADSWADTIEKKIFGDKSVDAKNRMFDQGSSNFWSMITGDGAKPLPVVVTNARDVGDAASNRVNRDFNKAPIGGNHGESRMTPWGADLAVP